jgi:hypothetical protein
LLSTVLHAFFLVCVLAHSFMFFILSNTVPFYTVLFRWRTHIFTLHTQYITAHLYLYSNKLSGTIPTTMGQLTNLKELVIDQNEFVGALPEELSSLTNLVTMFVFENKFNGTMPEPICQLIKKKNNNNGNGVLKNLWADCMEGFNCTCCTACCVSNSAYDGCFYVEN